MSWINIWITIYTESVFRFAFFSETPPFPNVNDLYKQFTLRDLLLENVWYISYINAILKWMGVDMNECIQANSKNWVLDRYWSVLYSCRIQPSTDTHTILPGTVPVLGCNGLHRVCIGSVLYTGWRYKNGIAQYRVSTVGIEQYCFCISFLLYTKNLHQYGTVQYRVYTGYPVPGIGIRYWMVSERCAKRYRSVPFQYRVPGIRYRNSTSFYRTTVLERYRPVP